MYRVCMFFLDFHPKILLDKHSSNFFLANKCPSNKMYTLLLNYYTSSMVQRISGIDEIWYLAKNHQGKSRDKYYPWENETLSMMCNFLLPQSIIHKGFRMECTFYLNYFRTCLEGMIPNMSFHQDNLRSNNFDIWMQILSLRQNDFIKYIKF